jgi:hypothetical protein
MQDAVHFLAGPFETSFLYAGLLYMFFWIVGHKPTNLEALYVFGAASAFVSVINFVDSSNWLFLFLLLSWMPSAGKNQTYSSIKMTLIQIAL